MKYNVLFALLFAAVVIYASVDLSHGIVGMTKLNGEGCLCHNLDTNDSVMVWIEGPDSVVIGDTTLYRIMMSGGPAIRGGFNVASFYSRITPGDSTVQPIDNELTHFDAPFFNGQDTISWPFFFIAADSVEWDTLYSVGLSANGDSIPTEADLWNFGENFVVHIVPMTTGTGNGSLLPDKFVLSQNYPNPFNPTTTISYSLPNAEKVKLEVFSLTGEKIATLVNRFSEAGNYKAEFRSEGLPSGIYFYRLQAGKFVNVKKMILIK